ncbi:MAG TPA: type II toxin-antitoxin system VapC family toxin [Gammaproteobacteria bacterium]|jgi:hypothetical protein|nr:type II toxin-antitoxin system VapC family toxin [Gammaproteobacteria bacterium]
MSYLIDTNIISELIRSKPHHAVAEWFKNKPKDSLYLSVLTWGEIRKGIEKVTDNAKKKKLTVWLEQELPSWFYERILPVDHEVADRWGKILAATQQSLPAIDSLIAATAIHYNLRLVTRNVKDFKSVPLLDIINPWD